MSYIFSSKVEKSLNLRHNLLTSIIGMENGLEISNIMNLAHCHGVFIDKFLNTSWKTTGDSGHDGLKIDFSLPNAFVHSI